MTEQVEVRAPLASPGHRLGAIAVDSGLYVVTFGIGWMIWNFISWGSGQTPGKTLLKIRVLNEPTTTPATWGQMLIRQALIPITLQVPFLVAYVVFITKIINSEISAPGLFGLIACVALYFALWVIDVIWIFGPTHRRLVDYLSGTIVVNEAGARS